MLPLQGYYLSARFGEVGSLWSSTHTGLDFVAGAGTPVAAVAPGVVEQAGYAGAYGNRVVLRVSNGTRLWFCHLDTITVGTGARLAPGDQLGTVGSTGQVTGPHLHLEVRVSPGTPVDPFAALVSHGLQP